MTWRDRRRLAARFATRAGEPFLSRRARGLSSLVLVSCLQSNKFVVKPFGLNEDPCSSDRNNQEHNNIPRKLKRRHHTDYCAFDCHKKPEYGVEIDLRVRSAFDFEFRLTAANSHDQPRFVGMEIARF